MKRHLIYYCYPRPGKMLDLNLSSLPEIVDKFDGVKSMVVAVDETALMPDGLPYFDNLFMVPNNQRFQETAYFSRLLETVKDEPGVTFYAHAKGVTRNIDRNRTVLPWTQFMYEALLDPRALKPLESHACVGAFRRFGTWKRWGHGWSYPGTFFWFRNDALTGDLTPTRSWWGVEQWTGKLWHPEEAAVLVKDYVQSLYRERYFNEEIVPAMDAWRHA